MAAASSGSSDICALLLERGAPWNAIDRMGRCAGDYATDREHWEVVNLLVEAGTRAELVLGAAERLIMRAAGAGTAVGTGGGGSAYSAPAANSPAAAEVDGGGREKRPVEHEPCTKPDYLTSSVRYDAASTLLLDSDGDAVMMEWERPLMRAHASVMTGDVGGKRVLNVGFGLGIIDSFLQEHDPSLHVIVEAHPAVYKRMTDDGWNDRPGVRVCFGRWQDVVPALIDEGMEFDGVFYDTYGEHHTDLEDFHVLMSRMLARPGGVYSFFNGLAPDNLFFHGVACNCVKLQLSRLGLESEFATCEVKVEEKDWVGVRRKYWHGRDTYYLPIVTWDPDFLERERVRRSVDDDDGEKKRSVKTEASPATGAGEGEGEDVRKEKRTKI